MTFLPFQYARIPPIYFGPGKLAMLPRLVAALGGSRVLLVTGAHSLEGSGRLDDLRSGLQAAGVPCHRVVCGREPTAAWVDGICADFRSQGVDVVVAIGGGSVVDAGKAVSAMLPHERSIFDHLEGVGLGVPHDGVKVPFIAVPTTSGTGSEVTKNAVISEVGEAGYKKSIRHDNLVPDAVVVDSELMVSCPREVTAACGMDALTQLMEPFLSPTVSPVTEALAWSGLEAAARNLLPACGSGASDLGVRSGMAYASLLSGVALANDGLGIVHGLAGPLGGFFPIPHGVACGTLVGAAARANLNALREREPQSPALEKMARLGRLFSGEADAGANAGCDALVATLDAWTEQLEIPRLSRYGITRGHLDKITEQAANRNNPVKLTRREIWEILEERL